MSILSTLASVLPLILDGKFLTGVVVGAVACVSSTKVYNFVKAKTAQAEAAVPAALKTAESAVANVVSSKL